MQDLRVTFLSLSFVCVAIVAAGCPGGDDDDSASGNGAAAGTGMNSNAGSGGTSSGSGGTSSGSGAATGTDACSVFCAKATPLHCSGDTKPCADQCSAYYDSSVCRDELRALVECASTQAASDFECDAQKQGDVKTSLCMSERTAAQTCVGSQ